ncbi:MAG: hypothetical protein HRT89_11165 [Lentisphaeria bacterium]|nr:hypothetical protein [Lentisphaeria bacterium]NQZ68614.1 hypothetical protein [Lentisphaeria bacterium]
MTAYTGFLYSQIGYNHDQPKRLIVRGPVNTLPDHANFTISQNGDELYSGPITHWGETWGSHWWIGDFSELTTCGTFSASIHDGDSVPFTCDDLHIGDDILWQESFDLVALDQLERRNGFSINDNGVKEGWLDAGMPWQEANSHAATLLGLCDIIDHQADRLSESQRERLEKQIRTGADYLVHLQNKASKLGKKAGACVHQSFVLYQGKVPPLNELVLPGDVSKLSGALARVANVINDEKTELYRERATLAMDWILNDADYTALPFLPGPHRLPDDVKAPQDIPTSDLVMILLCAIESGDERAPELAKQWLARQIKADNAQDGIYGHFYLWDDERVIERNWWHGVAGEGMGYNNGQTLGHHLMVLIRLIKALPEHPDNADWCDALKHYCYGYFIPACQSNPFYLMPNVHYADEGFLGFAGLWHGINAIYGNAAALAMALYEFYPEEELIQIATGNLQWIAGLNSGVTKDSLEACMVYSIDIDDDIALPASQIHGIGNRSCGCWLNLKGAITNGFCTGQQFAWDVEQTRDNDGPFTLTDEDWITHSGGWFSGLSFYS